MKVSQKFHQYIWIINTLKKSQGMTFEELNQRWQADQVTDGNALVRSSFNRHRDAILNLFGIVIDCDMKTYKYYIGNHDVLADGSIEQWLFSTLTVHGTLSDSAAVKDRLVLEDVPEGLQFLDTIVSALKTDRCLLLGYRKFGTEGYVKTVCPYALKLFHQRWYLLASKRDDGEMRIYALDRMTQAVLTDEGFEMPEDFSPQDYFDEYFGVLTDGTPMAHVTIRAHGRTPYYLRTLPLHHSQRELESGDGWTDFSFDLRPTADFLGELLSHGSGIEVLGPASVRALMRSKLAEALERYQ